MNNLRKYEVDIDLLPREYLCIAKNFGKFTGIWKPLHAPAHGRLVPLQCNLCHSSLFCCGSGFSELFLYKFGYSENNIHELYSVKMCLLN